MYPAYITDSDTLDLAFQDIISAIHDESVGFLFGAGMSAESKVPTGGELLSSLLRLRFPDTGFNPPSDDVLDELAYRFPFEAAVEAIEHRFGRRREQLTETLTNLIIKPQYQPSPAHDDFRAVCLWGGQQRVDRIFTTNFDLLLETVLGDSRAEAITEQSAKQIQTIIKEGRIPILHLHGLLDKGYLITETELASNDYKALNFEFRTALGYKNAFVFVGYSMNDPDFRSIYLSYREDIINRKSGEKRTYVVSPAKDEYDYRWGKDVWDIRGADWIPLDATTFFARLKYLLETRFDKDARNSVKDKFNLSDDQALQDLIARVADALRAEPVDALEFLFKATKRPGGGP
jgi:hypothetical protein